MNEPCYIGADGVKLLKIINNDFVPKYVFYALLANPVNSQGYSRHFKFLKEKKIKIASKKEQRFIIEKLDSIKESIELKESELKSLDELIKSRFNEMFLSRKDLPTKKWADVLTIYNGRDYKSNISNEIEGFPVYGSGGFMGVYTDRFICEGTLTIIGRKGTIDRPILVKGKIWNIDTAFGIKTDSKVLNPIFFYYRSKFYDYKGMNKQTTKPSLTKSDLLKLDIELPSMNDQCTFVDFVEQIDKSKFVVHSKYFLWEFLALFSSTMAYSSVVSILAWPNIF